MMRARGLRIAPVYGGVGIDKQARIARDAHVVVATPGRLEDLLARRALSLEHVRILVLDEADRMLDMGFKPAVDRIVAKCPRDRQTLFFSATLEGEAGRVARAYTRDPVFHEHRPEPASVAAVEHRFVAAERDQRLDALVGELNADDRDLALVFVRTKRGADRLVKRLGGAGVPAVAMHGNKSQRQREQALSRFEAGHVDTLVATDVAARGLDVDGISHVINFDPPEDRDGYVHRVGRTARAGRSGVGITFVGAEQAGTVQKIATDLRLDREFSASAARPPQAPPQRVEPAAWTSGSQGRTAVVTGAGRGIGAATADQLAAEGARVVRVSRSEGIDVTAPDAAERIARLAAPHDIDILVNNAGTSFVKGLEELTDDDWNGFWELHVMAPMRLMRAFAPGMAERGWGRIVNVASSSGKRPSLTNPAYSVSKAAQLSVSRVFADTYAARGVLVNAVAPGAVAHARCGSPTTAWPPRAPPPVARRARRRSRPRPARSRSAGWPSRTRSRRPSSSCAPSAPRPSPARPGRWTAGRSRRSSESRCPVR